MILSDNKWSQSMPRTLVDTAIGLGSGCVKCLESTDMSCSIQSEVLFKQAKVALDSWTTKLPLVINSDWSLSWHKELTLLDAVLMMVQLVCYVLQHVSLTDLFHCRQTHEDCVSTKSCMDLTGIISLSQLICHPEGTLLERYTLLCDIKKSKWFGTL